MIDASEEDVEERFRTIDRELALYGAGLDERPQAIVLNKIDLLPEPPELRARRPADRRRLPRLVRDRRRDRGAQALAVPARARRCRRRARRSAELPEFLEYRPQPPARRAYRIYRTDRGFRIVGDAPEGEELEAALKAAGARKGQDVEIGDEALEWQ